MSTNRVQQANSLLSADTTKTYSLPSASDTLVGVVAVQTLSNKTLVAPVLGAASGTSLTLSGLTASQAVVTDGSKQLSSLVYASANTASALVQRDGSGNFSAGTITAALTGTASGNTTYTANQYGLVTSGSGNAMTVIAPDASTTKVLVSGGASAVPAWGTVSVSAGGTGVTSLTSHYIPIGNGTSAVTLLAPSATSGVALISQGSSANPAYGAINLAGGSSIVSGILPNANTTADSANTASAIITRDGSGNFAAATATLVGALVSGLTASQAVVTDGSKNLSSLAYASAATASALVQRDSNANSASNSFLAGYTTTVSGSGTVTLTAASTQLQFITGSSAQTFKLPVVSTLALGQTFKFVNNSTVSVTVQSSGSNTIVALPPDTNGIFTVISTSGTTASSWSASYSPNAFIFNNLVTIARPSSFPTLKLANPTTTSYNAIDYVGDSGVTWRTITGNSSAGAPFQDNFTINNASGFGAVFRAYNTTGIIEIPSLTASQVVATDASKMLQSVPYASSNTVSAIVQRDSSGNFSAGIATLTGALVSGLTASQAVVTDGSKNLASLAYASAATASALVQRDSNANSSSNSFISGYATTATAAGTTTLTVSSAQLQYFTGSTTQTVVLPAVSSLVLGQSFTIVNLSSGVVTVQSSGTNTVQAMAANTRLILTVIATTGTDATPWSTIYSLLNSTGSVTSVSVASANGLAGSSSGGTTPTLTLSTSVTGILQGDGTAISAATATGSGNVVLASGPTLVAPLLGIPASGTLTNCTGLPISTGISGLGSGVATFLATPSSANLASAVTDETGTGALVFANTPTLVTPILGTPTSGTLTNCTGLPVSTGISGLGTGVATFLATASSANLASAISDETGSGALVFATSPSLVTPLLGTPTSGTLTNCTGLPISSGVSGLGTGVATFLATPSSANLAAAITDETGSGALVFATSPSLVTPLLGTPTSGTLTNCTGLPISSGVSGLGTGVATFLATPSSANLAAAVTDETGTGALVFANSPSLVTPSIGAATGTSLQLSGLTASQAVVTDGSKNLSSLAYASAATASALVQRDANANSSSNSFLAGYATIASGASTQVLTVSSPQTQFITGTSNQTFRLPVVSTLVLGQTFKFVNNSTGTVTVQSSGANAIVALPADTNGTFTVISTSGTGTASWSVSYGPNAFTFNNLVTFARASSFPTLKLVNPTASSFNAIDFVGDSSVTWRLVTGNSTSSSPFQDNFTINNSSGFGAVFRAYNTTGLIEIPSLTASQVVVTDASKMLQSVAYASANTASAIVQRDGSGNISVETVTAGNLIANTAGTGLQVKEGSNAKMGISTLVAGTVTVSTTAVTANSRIFLTAQNAASVNALAVTARTAATSFTITSSLNTDTSDVAWMLVEPA